MSSSDPHDDASAGLSEDQSSHSCKTPPWTRSTKRTRLVGKKHPYDRSTHSTANRHRGVRRAAESGNAGPKGEGPASSGARSSSLRPTSLFFRGQEVIGGAFWTRTLSVNWRQADKKRSQSQQNLVSFGSRGGSSLAAHCGSSFEG